MTKAFKKVKGKFHWLLAGALIVAISTVVLFNYLEIALGYTVYGHKFIIQNNLGAEIFSIDDSGLASDEGSPLTWDDNSEDLPALTKPLLWLEGFELRNAENQIIFYVEVNGTVHLDGIVNQFQAILDPVGSGNFILQNQDNEIFAYVDPAGNLYLRGKASGY